MRHKVRTFPGNSPYPTYGFYLTSSISLPMTSEEHGYMMTKKKLVGIYD